MLKASITRILVAHFESLWMVYDPEGERKRTRSPRGLLEIAVAILDVLVLFGLPFLIAFAIARRGIYPNGEVIGWIVSFVSLTSGLLFSVLVLLFSSVSSAIATRAGQHWRLTILEQLGGNVLFAVVVGFAVVLGFAVTGTYYPENPNSADIPMPVATLSLGLFLVFVFHLGLVLKRTHSLFVDNLNGVEPKT